MKSSWVGLVSNWPRLIGMMLTVLVGVSSYGWGQEAQPTVTKMGDLLVNVGESVRIEAAEATKVALADPTIADAQVTSDKEILVIGKKPGVTTIHVYEKAGAEKAYRVVVSEGEYPSKTIREAINLPDVHTRVVGNSVILEGSVSNDRELERALSVAGAYREKVVNLLEVTNPVQVRIRVKVADVNIGATKNKGLEYPDTIAYAFDFGGLDSAIFPIPHGFASPATSGTALKAPAAPGIGTPPPIFAKLNILQKNGDARILAEPTLVTLSGKEASFLAGGEFPVVIALQNSFSVEFKEFGVKMKIKPVVDSKENINTTLTAEVSSIDPSLKVSSSTSSTVDIPALITRKATTTVQLKNGQTIMIGGLLNRETTEALRKVPWIGEVPVLGLLFSNKFKDRTDRELIFFATFDLVRNPTAEAEAAPVSNTMKETLAEPKFKAAEEEAKKAHGKTH